MANDQNQETLKSTEELEAISQAQFEEVRQGLEALSQVTEGPIETRIEEFGPLAPPGSTMAIALEHEGLGPALIARKLRVLLESTEPKWNKENKVWDYFISGELWRKCAEMVMKVRGDFAPEKRINVNIDATLEDLLKASAKWSPEEAGKKIRDYIDVEVENK